MEPRIQYAQTKDGIGIAYYTVGKGIPLVEMPLMPWSHIQLQPQLPEWVRWTDRLSEKRMVVRYDPRGSGLSDRRLPDYSLDSMVLDLEAVVDAVGLDRFALFTVLFSGPIAIDYAARHPERVSHLLLWCAYAAGSEYADLPQVKAFEALRQQDWEIYTQAGARAFLGWAAAAGPSHWYAEYMQQSTTQEAVTAFYEANAQYDATPLLSQVKTPTLVMHRREFMFPGVDPSRNLASRIPNAHLAILDGASAAPWLENTEAVLDAIDDFVGEGEEAAEATPLETGAFRTILFTDVEGSTALTQRLGDAKARELLREHERMVREALKAHGGSELKTTGDGFMASFSSATKALESAIAMQRAFAAHNESAEEPILVRVGMNAGEPIAEEKDLFGTAVIEAARIAAAAKGGEILVSNVVRELAKGKKFLFSDRGEVALKGFDEPVRLYEVRWREEE
jgi:class 3 adenylate cyclase